MTLVPPSPFFDLATGTLRFWVALEDGNAIGATITKETLHYLFSGHLAGDDATETYERHRHRIDAAVRRRFAAGSREPVMLRDHDVAPRFDDVTAANEPNVG